MEAEVRAILAEAVREPADSARLFTALLDRFGALGGVDLDLLMRPEPAATVASWVRERDRRELRTTVITVAEVRYGIARLPEGRRKQVLAAAADEIFAAFDEQVLPVEDAAAEHYAAIASRRERAGKPIGGFDALIAAVGRAHGATLATRNVPDFEGTGIDVDDPWLQSPT
jgi:hypothetical protein